jgi:integrase
MLCLARYAGLRIHECFRIDTAIAGNTVRNMEMTIKGKNGKVRTIPIQETIRIELEKMLSITPRGHKLFVPDGVKTDYAISCLQRFIRNHRDEVRDQDSQRPMTYHGLRHNYACEHYLSLLEKGFTDSQACKQVSIWMGHEREEITRIYLVSVRKVGDAGV